MARHEADREDIFHEARALRRRVELALDDRVVVAGFRATGELSLFFGQDVVSHYNTTGKLHRAYLRGCLFRAEPGGLLTRLRRERDEENSVLLSHVCTNEEIDAVLTEIRESALTVLAGIDNHLAVITRCFPEDQLEEILADLLTQLRQLVRQGLAVADGM